MRKAQEIQHALVPKLQNNKVLDTTPRYNERVTQKPSHDTNTSPSLQEQPQKQDQSPDPGSYTTKVQLKSILFELFENQQITTLDWAGKLSIIEKNN